MRVKTQLKEIASYSKGSQINGDELVPDGAYDYLNGGIAPSGKWIECNTPGGTVTISEGGNSCGFVNYMQEPFWCGAHCYYLFDTLENSKYLYYLLKSQQDRLMGIRTGACMPNIKKADLGRFEVEYDTDEDQQKIVVLILNRVESIISSRQHELQMLDNLIKARFVEMFGTLDKPSQPFNRDELRNLCTKITDGKHGGCTREEGTCRYFVGAKEIYDDAVHYDTAPEINIAEFEKDYKRCNVEKGDFLIVNTGATIGKSAIATDDRTKHTLLQKSVALLKVKSELLNPVFLKYCYIVNDKMYKVDSASAQPNLLLSKINMTEIYVPDMRLQEEFVSFSAQVDKSKVVIQKSLDETQVLFDSLMQEYFG